jgi:hypothetical protein
MPRFDSDPASFHNCKCSSVYDAAVPKTDTKWTPKFLLSEHFSGTRASSFASRSRFGSRLV